MKQKTTHPTLAGAKKDEKWYVLDAEGKVLGHIATVVATMIRGKHKPTWDPSVSSGDHIVIINADKVVLTGNKEVGKEYIHHTGFPGGVKYKAAGKMRAEHPERMIEMAVTGMIPRNRLRQHALAKLHVYAGSEHPHAGQNPQSLTL